MMITKFDKFNESADDIMSVSVMVSEKYIDKGKEKRMADWLKDNKKYIVRVLDTFMGQADIVIKTEDFETVSKLPGVIDIWENDEPIPAEKIKPKEASDDVTPEHISVMETQMEEYVDDCFEGPNGLSRKLDKGEVDKFLEANYPDIYKSFKEEQKNDVVIPIFPKYMTETNPIGYLHDLFVDKGAINNEEYCKIVSEIVNLNVKTQKLFFKMWNHYQLDLSMFKGYQEDL